MADPIKLRIAYAIRARLQTILTAGGFNTNAGADVTIGRQSVDGETDPPCIVIRQGAEDATASGGKGATVRPTGGSSKMTCVTEFDVDGYIVATQTNGGIQQMLIEADIKKAMNTGADLYESGLRLGTPAYLGSEPFTREDGAGAEGVRVKFAVTHLEKYGDPYATANQQ